MLPLEGLMIHNLGPCAEAKGTLQAFGRSLLADTIGASGTVVGRHLYNEIKVKISMCICAGVARA